MKPTPDQHVIDQLVERLRGAPKEKAQANGQGQHPTATRSDEEIIAKCRSAKNAAKFSALFDHGDTSAYENDDSDADFALLGTLKFYTQDPDQLDRLFRRSALYRAKWDERRGKRTYGRMTIDKALEDVRETYSWEVSSSSPPIENVSDDDTCDEDVKVVWFAELGEPKEREYLIEKIAVKGYPIVAFGAGGVAKSFAMLAAGVSIASASGAEHWLGLQVLEHGYALYMDFELDVDEQHRRVRDLCAGLGVPVPKRLAYLSGVGIPPEKVFKKALAFVKKYSAKAVIIDSMGLAMAGDMERGKDVLGFHSQFINPLRRAGATPFIVDHEGKLQVGEKHKHKSPIGSAYKAWAARNVLQFELEEYDKENSALDIRVRQTKTNFTPIDPFSVRFTFEEKKVSMEPFELEDTELVEEESIPVRERILSALRAGPATNAELQDVTGATVGTIRNNLSQLIQAELVTEDGGRPKTYRLVSSSTSTKGSDDDTNDEPLSYHVAPGESFTVEQLQRIRKLMRQGMSEKWAKKAVLADRHSVGCGCEVCR